MDLYDNAEDMILDDYLDSLGNVNELLDGDEYDDIISNPEDMLDDIENIAAGLSESGLSESINNIKMM